MKTFVPGEIARASDVNANFQELAENKQERISQATAVPIPGWNQIQNRGNLTKIGNTVMFDGIGLAKVWNFDAGSLNEFRTLIPAGYRPVNEVCGHGAIIQNWRAYSALVGIRPNGTLYVLSSTKVYLTKADIYNYVLIPSMSWQAA